MSRFLPQRVSTPTKSTISFSSAPTTTKSGPATVTGRSDHSRSSATSVPELANLTSDQIEFIDAVISRASPSATTFLTVFKAYNDVLHDRGLDPENEVVYYGKLLKLGTLKGKNWGDKWDGVKERCGYVSSAPVAPQRPPSAGPSRAKAIPPEPSSSKPRGPAAGLGGHGRGDSQAGPSRTLTTAGKLLARLRNIQHRPASDQTETSVIDATDATQTEATDETEIAPRFHRRRSPPARPSSAQPIAGPSRLGAGTPSSFPPHTRPRNRQPSTESETFDDTAPSMPTKPLPIRNEAIARNHKAPLVAPRAIPAQTHTRPSSSEALRAEPSQRRSTAIHEEDAWNKVRMMQDEKYADDFRRQKLLERCWDVWRQGLDWVITTGEQISEARDKLILRLAIHKWRTRLQALNDLSTRAHILHSNLVQQQALDFWRHKLKLKRQNDWRDEMRAKMKLVRQSHDSKLLKEAWAKWRQLHQSKLSDQHHKTWVVKRFFGSWKRKLATVEGLQARVEVFSRRQDQATLEKAWDVWTRSTELSVMEGTVANRVATRLAKQVVSTWRRKMTIYQQADTLHELLIKKHALAKWKASQVKLKALERRADRHLASQDDILVRALFRIWQARMHGGELERQKNDRLLKQAWVVWKQSALLNQQREEKALAFSLRANSSLATIALRLWKQRLARRREKQLIATQYHQLQLQSKMLFQWRVQLRVMLKMTKDARALEKFFVIRNAWKTMKVRLEERRRERKLQELETEKTKKAFTQWLQKALRLRHHRLAEQELRSRVEGRVLKNALVKWTNRVIEIKLRELDVGQTADKLVVQNAFTKWKRICVRHAEELSLMESYQDVKREENIRRMFYKWLTAARTVRRRRVVLQEKEREMKQYLMASAWDKWRGAFKAEKLRSAERLFVLQNQNALMYRAFVTWHSKTKSLPAVRFHATNTKAKYWQIWRDAMPHALQAKKAREFDKNAVLAKALEKWRQAHSAKKTLRAAARARYIRLPAPRAAITSKLHRPQPDSLRLAPSRARHRVASPDPTTDAGSDAEATEVPAHARDPIAAVARTRAPSSRSGIASLLSSRPPSNALSKLHQDRGSSSSLDRPRFTTRSVVGGGTRNSSPTRVVKDLSPTRTAPVGGDDAGSGRGRMSLWSEMKGIQRRSKTPTVRSYRSTPEPS